MPEGLVAILLAVFTVHLLVFLRIALRRGGLYYWLVVAVFSALSLSFSLRLWAGELQWAGTPLHQLARYLAWALAAVTIPWMLLRLHRRTRPEPPN